MDSVEIHNLLSFLQRLEQSWCSDLHTKDIIRRLKLKINILIPDCQVEHRNLEISTQEDVIQEFKQPETDPVRLRGEGDRRSTPTAVELVLSDLEKLRFIKPEMEQMYSVVFNSPRSITSESNEDVVSFISLLHENLKNILSSKAGILVPVKPQILALQDELRFLRNFLCFISQICVEHRLSKELFIFAHAVAVNAAYLLHFLRVEKKMDEQMEYGVKVQLLDLIEKLNPLQQQDLGKIYLRALEGTSLEFLDLAAIDYECALQFFDSLIDNLRQISNETNLDPTSKDQIDILLEELSSLRFYLMDLPLHDSNKELDNLIFKIKELTIQTGCFIYSSICKKNNQFTVLASDEKFGGLLDKIEGVKSESDHFIIPRSWQSNFPETNELGYVDFIIKNLEERVHSISAPIDLLANQMNAVCEGLVVLRDDFGRVAKPGNGNEELKALFTRYRDAAYQTEYFVDSYLCGVVSFRCQKMGLVNLAKELQHIRKELKAILNDNIDHDISKSLSWISSQANPLSTNAVVDSENDLRNTGKDADQLVGFKDVVEKIMEQIMGGSDQLTILSIIGMPGLGKTTLANSVYRDPSVTMQFHARAWCAVSQVYNKKTLFLEILHQVQSKKEFEKNNNERLDQNLYQSLKGKRYLVVMDDIWDIEAWDDLRPSFPNDNNGSRIIFTTRCQSIATQANSVPHALRLLSDKESWKLLLVRVFKEENCPPELLQVGKKIAENCKGLPLTVVLTVGLLKIRERKKDSWEQFANVLISHEVDSRREKQLGILELSYSHLPDYLKPCFLYFGVLPEDAEIPVWKLVRLWIAEGFVRPKAGLNILELEAENYLNALIDRSLLMIAKRSYKGVVKKCRMHDLLRDFCIDRAKEESFILMLKRGDSLRTLTDSEVHEQYRLCIVQTKTSAIPQVRMGPFESRVRSLWFSIQGNLHLNSNLTRTALRGMLSSRLFSPPSCSRFRYYNKLRGVEVFFKFRLLRVLDLGRLNIVAEDSFDPIIQLVYLRYLSLLAYTRGIPAEIENLKDLETFLLTGTRFGNVVALPETIWNMVNLRHIRIKKGTTAYFPYEFIENCNKLNHLTSLSTLVVRHGNELEKMMMKLPNLIQLKCTLYDSWEDSENSNDFPVLDFLHQLEELSICSLYQRIVFPSSLKKLTLSEGVLFRDQISVIGQLPNLKVLKLVHVKTEDEWHMNEGEFQKLKFLTLDRLPIRIWNASIEHLPSLEQLVAKDCTVLQELPTLGESPFLRMIDVNYCTTSVVASAMKIREEQFDMGNDLFNLYISDDHWDL